VDEGIQIGKHAGPELANNAHQSRRFPWQPCGTYSVLSSLDMAGRADIELFVGLAGGGSLRVHCRFRWPIRGLRAERGTLLAEGP
jgi:hypothetical protein